MNWERFPITVVDLSAVKSTDALGHLKAGASPNVIAFVNALHKSGVGVFNEGKRRGLIEGSVAIVQQGTDILLAPLGVSAR